MRKLICMLAIVALAGAAYAELQNVTVGGELRIRGRYWNNNYNNAVGGPLAVRYPVGSTVARPLGRFGTASRFDFSKQGPDLKFVEMRTRVNVAADFTDDVAAFIELESFDIWGEDFRSNYVTGADARATTFNDVEMYQAYIETNETFGLPMRLRIGRQEMKFGKGWLVDDITTAIVGRSWDAIRMTYKRDDWELDAWWSKLAEATGAEEDGDIDFYGAYLTYSGFDLANISAYWMYIRDARGGPLFSDTELGFIGEGFEDFFGLDQYDTQELHTVGLRIFGGTAGFDYDWELAYQFGEADQVGRLFRRDGTYGDTGAEYDNFATDLEVGYSLDMAWSPRVFVGGAFFEGEDNRDISFGEFMFQALPWSKSSVSFNRMFPGKNYSPILGINQELSNFWQLRAGLAVKPFDKVSAGLKVAYFKFDEPFDLPYVIETYRIRVPLLPSFITHEASDELGWTTTLWTKYQYSEDLSIKLVWEHLFAGEGLEDGNFFARNGLEFVGAFNDDSDADYVHFDLQITF